MSNIIIYGNSGFTSVLNNKSTTIYVNQVKIKNSLIVIFLVAHLIIVTNARMCTLYKLNLLFGIDARGFFSTIFMDRDVHQWEIHFKHRHI